MKLALMVAMAIVEHTFVCGGGRPLIWDNYFHTYLQSCEEVYCYEANGMFGPCLPIPKELKN